MSEAAFWWVNTVTVEPYLGEKATGPAYGPPQSVDCWVEDETKLVRSGDGSEVVSSTQVYGPLEVAALFPVKSKVTTTTRTSFVIANNGFDSGSLALGLDHVEIALT
jgi:hypothetical protein